MRAAVVERFELPWSPGFRCNATATARRRSLVAAGTCRTGPMHRCAEGPSRPYPKAPAGRPRGGANAPIIDDGLGLSDDCAQAYRFR